MGKDKSAKKRARDEEAGEGAGAGPAKRVQVEVVHPAKDEAPALVSYLPFGMPPEGAEWSLHEHGMGRVKNYSVLGRKGNVEYVARTDSEDYAKSPMPCNFALGVYNKETGKLSVMPIAGSRIMRMEPRLPGLNYSATAQAGEAGAEDEEDGEETREERLAQNKKLVDSFGSTRRRRQLREREEGVVKVEKLGAAAGALATMITQVGEQAAREGLTKAEVLASAASSRALPPHNLGARTPEEAYPMSGLLPDEVVGSVRTGKLLAVLDKGEAAVAEAREKKLLHEYALGRLSGLRALEGDKRAAKRRALLLSLLSVLLDLKKDKPSLRLTPDYPIDRAARKFRTQPDVLEHLLTTFYNASPGDEGATLYGRDNDGTTRLVAYVCVTALLAEPGASLGAAQFEGLASALSMPPADLVQRFKEVGATVTPTTIVKSEADDLAPGGTRSRSYVVTLLPGGTKTLGESLPAIKLNKGKK